MKLEVADFVVYKTLHTQPSHPGHANSTYTQITSLSYGIINSIINETTIDGKQETIYLVNSIKLKKSDIISKLVKEAV